MNSDLRPYLFIILPIIGYLLGSLSFSLWVTRLFTGADVRAGGSGHATTTNAIRQYGWKVGLPIFFLDIIKGFIPVYLAIRVGAPGWLVGLTSAAAVAGHCWPIFSGFQGGMGLAVAMGGIFAIDWLAVVIGLGVLITLVLVLRHGARAAVISGVGMVFVYLLFGYRGELIWLAAFAGIVIAVRFYSDWRREYKELWLDRES